MKENALFLKKKKGGGGGGGLPWIRPCEGSRSDPYLIAFMPSMTIFFTASNLPRERQRRNMLVHITNK